MYHKKTYLLDLQRTRAGSSRDISSGILLDRNERSVPYDGKLTKLMLEKLAKINLCLYPEMPPFYDKLSHWLNVKNDEIYITEGVSGAIKSLIETLTIPGLSNIVFPYPTFALYKVYCEMFNVKPILVSYLCDYKLNYEELIRSINKDTAIVFLPNPNVPIHGTIELDKIKSLAEYCMKKNVLLVLDEVYYPFSNITGIKLIYVGIESEDVNVRKNSNRISEDNLNQIQKINFLEKIGINVKAMYIIGMPTDSPNNFLKTVNYAKKINSSFAQFSVFTPYPGTPAFSKYKKIITKKKYEDFTQWQLVFKHKNFKENDVLKLLNFSYRSYYFRITWIKKYIRNKIREIIKT